MSYSLDYIVREQLAKYLVGEVSLREFGDQFFPEIWNVDMVNNVVLLNLIHEIKLLLAELGKGDWAENELRGLLYQRKVGREGVEPSRPFGQEILSLQRLPFRHRPQRFAP